MEPELVALISSLGEAGERAFYVYMAVHYGTTVVIVGIIFTGVFHAVRYMIKHT